MENRVVLRTMMKWRSIMIVLLLIGGGCPFAPPTYLTAPIVYFGAPIRGRVIDADTKKPIAGAVVAVEWEIVGGWGTRFPFVSAESVTDQNGDFQVAGWGPKLRPPLGGILEDDPAIWVFKTGYGHRFLLRRFSTNSYIRRPDHRDQVIWLSLDNESPQQRVLDLTYIMGAAPSGPLLLAELAKERGRIPPSVRTDFFGELNHRRRKAAP